MRAKVYGVLVILVILGLVLVACGPSTSSCDKCEDGDEICFRNCIAEDAKTDDDPDTEIKVNTPDIEEFNRRMSEITPEP